MKKISLQILAIIVAFFSVQTIITAAQVSKTYTKPVYMHYMPWFDTPEFNGAWGWHWTMNNKNPNNIVDQATGKREIASHYYPLIGPYACSDPAVIEYHLLLMKYAGIDGVLVDWYGSQGTNPDINNLLNNSNALINQTDKAGIKFGLVLEDRFTGSIAQGQANMAYARSNYFNRSNYFRFGAGNDPVVGVFGPITYQTPGDWTTILSSAGEDVEFLPLWYEAADGGSNSDGEYVWVYEDENLDDYLSRMQAYYVNRAPSQKTVMGVAYPGFNDFYAQGGAGASYFNIPHNNGATLDQTLALVNQYASTIDILQLATWNDFGEGTVFEPTFETGYTYLTKLQRFLGVSYGQYELEQVYRLYKLRKQYKNDAAKQAQLNQAYTYFVALNVSAAVAQLVAVEGGTTPPPPTVTWPLQIEAESYSSMSGIQTEACSEGTLNVGWIEAGDWLVYPTVSFPEAGSYKVEYRIAGTSAASMKLELDGGAIQLGTISIPSTGGWQTWSTVNHTVNVPSAGNHTIRLNIQSSGFNLNWFKFTKVSTSTVAVTGVSLSQASASLNKGATLQLTATVAPSNATNKSVNWSSNNTAIATINASGLVTAVASGSAIIKVTTVDGAKTANCTLTVTTSPPTGTTYYRFKNRWQGTYLYESGDQLKYGALPASPGSQYDWVMESVGGGLYEFKNASSGEYMHIEHLLSYVECMPRTSGWSSSRWYIEDTGDGYVRIRNAWQGSQYIHIENLTGSAQHGTINTAWGSAQWKMETIVKSAEYENSSKADFDFTLAPNPTSDNRVMIYVSGSDTENIIEIIDLQGRIVQQIVAASNQVEIDLGGASNGIYFVRISNISGMVLKKMIVK